MNKEKVIERLKGNIKDINALIEDIDSWDIYNDDNWKSLIESMEDAVKCLKEDKANIIDIDYFGINEVNVILEFNKQKYSGCLTEVESEELENDK